MGLAFGQSDRGHAAISSLSTVDSIMATASVPFTSNLVSENGGRPTGRPKVSVVFNATDAEDDATLHERSNRWKHLDIEVVIVSSGRMGASGRESSDARLVYAPVDSSHTQRRALGLAAASGDLVIMLEASQRPDDGWIAQLAGDGSTVGAQTQL